MTEPVAPDLDDLPRLADALPPAEHHCARAVAHLEGRPSRGDLLDALVALLEAAGGPDVGNVVRTHLERTGAAVPDRFGADDGRARVLLAATRLHAAAEHDLRERLRRAGLADPAGPSSQLPSGRATRARHAERVLQGRRSAVERVVAALGAGALPAAGDGSWTDALTADLPPGPFQAAAPSQDETVRDAPAR